VEGYCVPNPTVRGFPGQGRESYNRKNKAEAGEILETRSVC